MTTLTVAALQLNSQDDVGRNLELVEEQVREAARRGARLIALPENFAFFGADDARREHAEPLLGPGEPGGPIQAALARWAQRYSVMLIAGGMPIRSSEPLRPHNTSLVVSPEGAGVGAYHKIHLFDVDLTDGTSLCESRGTKPGTEPLALNLCGIQVGITICYDLRFPELFRKLSEAGADLIVVTAAFTTHTGKDHWEVLLRARAIENQVWVLAAAQVGAHGRGRFCYGHSMLIDPWGAVVARASDRVGPVVGEIDLGYSARVRQGLPALRHRRL
jgi:deaminated glutathione amidase